MDWRTGLIAVGTGITTALVVAVLVIEALAFEFSAMIGLPVGLIAGLVAALAVGSRYGRVGRTPRSLLDGVAAFGYAVVLLLALRYVGRLGLRSVVTVERLLALAVVAGVVVAAGSWLLARQRDRA